MKKIILATIPSTGTNFFKKVFEDHGLEVKALHLTDQGLMRVLDMVMDDWTLVTTHRHISKVKESWRNRGRNDSLAEYLENWYTIQSLKPFVVSVDSANKDTMLWDLSVELGVPLKADWTPVPSRWKEAVR